MDEISVRAYLEEEADISFSRSSGPGGQNVNKTNTKVQLRVFLDRIPGLSPEELFRLKVKLAGRLTVQGELVVQVQDERSQILNRTIATERMLQLLVRGLSVPKPRRPSKPTRASKERRLTEKKNHSNLKGGRTRPQPE